MSSYIYPVFLSLIPALHLYASNRTSFKSVISSWIIIAGIVVILFLIIKRITKQTRFTGVITGCIAIAIFYFQPFLKQLSVVIYNLGISKSITGLQDSTPTALLILTIWVLLWVVLVRYLVRSDAMVGKANSYLLVVSLIMILSPLSGIARKIIYTTRFQDEHQVILADPSSLIFEGDLLGSDLEIRAKPDIYYLIFDGFGGERILEKYYETNIDVFLDQLDERGFYVASQSRSNYSQTVCSLSSSLNIGYLDGLSRTLQDTNAWDPFAISMRENQVSTYFDDQGYRSVTFSSGFWPTEGIRSDEKLQPLIALNEYEEILVQNTPLVTLFPDILYNLHRNRIAFTINNLSQVDLGDKPGFIFAHLYIPHPPFVFDENGNHVHVPRAFIKYDADGYRNRGGTTAEYQQMYSEQINYLFDRILIIIDEIIAVSENKPIIIIQGDHGPGSTITQRDYEPDNLDERFSIMNAYYFPDQDYRLLYPDITPVNTFRVILSQYFGEELELLPDRSFFSTVTRPFKLIEVTKVLK